MSSTTTETSANGALRIVRLEAESFKRLRVINITPDGTVVKITGRNGQGKSSVLDAIACAIGGAKLCPERPIRRGAKSASVEVDLGEMVVRRRWTESGNTYLEVVAKDGSPIKSAQAVLDRLVGDLTFDPLAFTRLDDRARLGVLRTITGLGSVFDGLNRERDDLSEKRRVINAQHKQAEARLSSIPAPSADTPDQEVSAAELIEQQQRATAQRAQNAELEKAYRAAGELVKQHEAYVVKVEQALADAREKLSKAVAAASMAHDSWVRDTVEVPSIDYAAKLRDIEGVNAAVRARQARAQLDQDVRKLARESADLTRKIEAVDVRKEEAVQGAKLPVPGLTFNEDGVLLNGVPFGQASSAEQLRASVAMGLAQNPRLRVMLVREGSLLDATSMAQLEEVARAHDAQVWVECVTNGEAVGVVIEDGEVRESEDAR